MSKTAKELYNEDARYWSSYHPMLSSFGNVLIQVDDDDWQGDSRVLYKDGDRYGYLQFGWGSCSGCDSLQACRNLEEVQNLMDNLRSQIKWFGSKEECLKFFETHDWEGDYSYRSREQGEFISTVKHVLRIQA